MEATKLMIHYNTAMLDFLLAVVALTKTDAIQGIAHIKLIKELLHSVIISDC